MLGLLCHAAGWDSCGANVCNHLLVTAGNVATQEWVEVKEQTGPSRQERIGGGRELARQEQNDAGKVFDALCVAGGQGYRNN